MAKIRSTVKLIDVKPVNEPGKDDAAPSYVVVVSTVTGITLRLFAGNLADCITLLQDKQTQKNARIVRG